MSTTATALTALQDALNTLEGNLEGKTAKIRNQYNEATKAADKAHKEALSIANKIKDNALEEFKNEKADIVKLKNAIKALSVESITKPEKAPKTTSAKESKTVTVVSSYVEANTNDKKVLFALSQIKSGTKEAIIDKLVELDSTINASAIQQIPSALKTKGVIKSIGKEGKKDIYSI